MKPVIAMVFAGLALTALCLAAPALEAPQSLQANSAGDAVGPSGCAVAPVTMIAVGDIQLGRVIYSEMVDRDDYSFPVQNVKERLKTADLVVGNLEAQIFPWCRVLAEGMRLCAGNRAMESLIAAGVDVVSVANNHAHNFGEKSLEQSVRSLRAAGIAVAGYGNKIPVLERHGKRFAFIAFSPVNRVSSLIQVKARIEAARKKADVVVAMVHWGVEYDSEPSVRQRDLAEYMTKKGVKLIVGSHPHVVQPLERINGVPVAFSLGNFIFDQMWSDETARGAAGLFEFCDGDVVKSELLPVTLVEPGIPTFERQISLDE